jgi:TolB protein
MRERTVILHNRLSGGAEQAYAVAHRWADEVVYQLSAGRSKGIAGTKIVYTSRRGNTKEVYLVDYDGRNNRAFTFGGSYNNNPTWAPDNSKVAYMSYRTGPPEINIRSYLDGSRHPFPIFNSLAMTPAISPDGEHIAFALRTPRGDTDIFISRLDGSERRNITNNPAVDTSPCWSPGGKQIAFTSDRWGRVNHIFYCDIDGANVRRIIKEGGDADAPSWSPDGRHIAFHWKPYRSIGYQIFIAEVGSGEIRQVTSGSGSKESPTWSPDGLHMAYQSDETGRYQIYIMKLFGDQEKRRITEEGVNGSPSWSNYFPR